MSDRDDELEAAPPEVSAAAVKLSGKYLTFVLDGEEYGIRILAVQEIIGSMSVTKVPRTPAFLRGVINLRGKIIPVVEMRAKFGMPEVEDTPETCIIVVRTAGVEMGIVVDAVSEVVDIAPEMVDESPNFGAAVDSSYIVGIGKVASGVKVLLDVDQVLAVEQAEAEVDAA